MFIFTLLSGASKGFMKALKPFIKPFKAPQRSVKKKDLKSNFMKLSFFSRDDLQSFSAK